MIYMCFAEVTREKVREAMDTFYITNPTHLKTKFGDYEFHEYIWRTWFYLTGDSIPFTGDKRDLAFRMILQYAEDITPTPQGLLSKVLDGLEKIKH